MTPIALVSSYAAGRRGEHWALTVDEQRAMSDALAGVVTELIPFLPVVEDSPLAAALTQLTVTSLTVIGGRVYMDYLIAQAARLAAEQAAAEPQPANVSQFGLVV